MFFGRASSRSTWRWFSFSSAASSIVTMRWSSGIAVESAFSSVVLPVPVPPEIRMFSSARTQRLRKSTVVSGERAEPDQVVQVEPLARRTCGSSRSGPVSDSGGMIALTRLPSGRRASTIGEDSSMRRPTWATILLMIRRRCDSSVNRTGVSYSRPSRSTQTSYGPLTMISVTVSSASSRSSGPWPRMSSAIASAMAVAVVAREAGLLGQVGVDVRRRPARAAWPSSRSVRESCGPSSPITARWTRFLTLGERIDRGRCVAAAAGRLESRSWSSIMPSLRAGGGARGPGACDRGAGSVSSAAANALAASDFGL